MFTTEDRNKAVAEARETASIGERRRQGFIHALARDLDLGDDPIVDQALRDGWGADKVATEFQRAGVVALAESGITTAAGAKRMAESTIRSQLRRFDLAELSGATFGAHDKR